MTILVTLFGVFFGIGLFCFGGGYVIIPLIQEEIVSRGWLSVQEFVDIIAVAESTPGPISINTATFVGYKLSGWLGASIATLGLCLPTFIIVVLVSRLLMTDKGKIFLDRIMVGIRPVVVALVFAAAFTIGGTVLVTPALDKGWLINYSGIILALVAFLGTMKFKLHPIILIALGAAVGLIL